MESIPPEYHELYDIFKDKKLKASDYWFLTSTLCQLSHGRYDECGDLLTSSVFFPIVQDMVGTTNISWTQGRVRQKLREVHNALKMYIENKFGIQWTRLTTLIDEYGDREKLERQEKDTHDVHHAYAWHLLNDEKSQDREEDAAEGFASGEHMDPEAVASFAEERRRSRMGDYHFEGEGD